MDLEAPPPRTKSRRDRIKERRAKRNRLRFYVGGTGRSRGKNSKPRWKEH